MSCPPPAGPLPASPPPVLAAALEAGLLSCLQHVVWWAERDLAGRSFLSDIAARWARGRLLGGGGFWPLAYGDVAQSLELLSALARVLPQGAAQPGAAEAGCDCTCVLLVTIKPLLDFSYGFLANSYPRVWRSGSPSSSSPPAPPSGGSGPPLAAAPPPPGLPRLELVAAHAARLLLPRLSRLMCGLAGTAQQGRGGTAASGRLIRHCEGVSGCVLVWVEALTTLCAPGGSTSSSGAGGGGTGGSGTGRCTGRGVSSSSGSSMGGGMGASGSTGGGSTPHGSPTQLQVTLLRRFLLEEVRVLELLGAMLRSLPAVKATPQASMYASALTTAAAAFASELAHAMMEAGRCGGAGFAGGGSGAGAGAGRARSRANGSTGPGPSPGHRPHPVWPPDLVRSLGRQLEQEGSACHGTPLKQLENMLRANLLLGSLAPQPGGIGGSHGGGGQHVLQLPPAWSPSMVRTLYEVLGAEAGDPA